MPERQSPPCTHVLAFDFGLRHIGVAVGNALLGSATPLASLKARDGVPDWNAITALLGEWNPGRLIVGLPLNMDGTASEMSARAERFARRLHGRFGLPCETMDERLSSREARSRLASERGFGFGDGRVEGIDSTAACLILESWYASRQRED
jgi:putative Holliday junction resolvase